MSVLLGMSVLCVSGCGSSRQATSSSTELRTTESRIDTVREQVMVAVHDTLTITKTITIRENEHGDTIRMNTVMDRERIRDRAAVKDKEEKVVVKTDTVYIEHRDSVFVEIPHQVRNEGGVRASPVVSSLKWIFWIIVAIGGLIIIAWVALRLKI